MALIKTLLILIFLGGAGYSVATLFGVALSLGQPRWAIRSDEEERQAFSQLVQIIFLLPLSEATIRYFILTKMVDQTKKISAILFLGLGWFLADTFFKHLTDFDFANSTFLGVGFLGLGQTLLMQIAFFAVSFLLIAQKLEFRLVILATFLFHLLYSLSLHYLGNYQVGFATPDDMIAMFSFTLVLVIFWHFSRLENTAASATAPPP